MEFQPFDHARLLADAWRHGAPRHNLGSSGFVADSWAGRGLPPVDVADADPMGLHLHAETHLRDRLARRFDHDPAGVVVTAGTTGANTAVLQAFLTPGCNVVLERPTYTPLASVAQAFGAEVRHVERGTKWRLDPEDVAAAVDDATALIVLSSPNNPTGVAASQDDLRRLGDIAASVDAHVLVDQVYRELTDHAVAATLHPRLITTAGLNKCWGAPGLRIGWIVCAPALGPRLHEIHRLTHLAAPVASEVAAAVLLDHEGACRRQLEDRLDANDRVWSAWCAARGVAPGPKGLVNFVDLPLDTAHALEAGILLLPGRVFGWDSHVRVGLGVPTADLRTSLDALGRLLDAPKP